MRQRYQEGTLSSEMAVALDEALGDVWRVRHHAAFGDMLNRVKAFQQSYGRLPHFGELDANGVNIGYWVQKQRDKHNAGRLPADRVAALQGVPGWTWKYFEKHDAAVWVGAVRAYEQANGHLPKQRDSWGHLNIGVWITTQRIAYHKGLLPAELVASLEAVPGWVWKKRTKRSHRIPFEAGLAYLNHFVQVHGRLPGCSQIGDVPDKIHLGSWVQRYRRRKKQGKLTSDQIAALEQVPGWWWVSKTPFRL